MRNCSLRVSATLAMLACALGALASGRGKEVCRVETRTVSTPIPFDVRYEFSRLVGPGRCVKVQNGRDGEIVKTYRVYFMDGKPVSTVLADTEKVAPVDALYHMGKNGHETSRGAFHRSKVLTMYASAYDPSPATIGYGATGRTATGEHAGFGCAAVDPRVIPLGTMIYVEGYGFAKACDTGGAIHGNRIDLCFGNRGQALRYGRKTVRVHVFKGR